MTPHLRRPPLLLALVALGGAIPACSDSADPAGDVSHPEIQLSEVAVLDFTSAEVAPSFEARVFPLPADEGWLVSAKTFGGFVQMLDPAGRPSGQLGREGGGPGEISGPVYGHSVGDEIWLLDPAAARLSRFAPQGEFLDSRMLAAKVSSVDVDRTREGLVVGGYFDSDESLMRVGADPGDDLRGGEMPPMEGDLAKSAGRQWQFVAMPTPDEIWTVSRTDGVLRLHDPQLRVLERVQLDFPGSIDDAAWESDDAGSVTREKEAPGGAPEPESTGLLSADGIVWVVTGIADADWHDQMRASEVAIDDWVDTFLFALDAASREVVATHRMDRACFPAYGALLSCVDEVGQRITLVELSLRPSGQ